MPNTTVFVICARRQMADVLNLNDNGTKTKTHTPMRHDIRIYSTEPCPNRALSHAGGIIRITLLYVLHDPAACIL